MGYNLAEKKDPLPDALEWETREKSKDDILLWDVEEAA